MIKLILFLILSSFTLAANDPWQPYENQSKGKGKGHPGPVPETSSYGLIFTGICVTVFILHRKFKLFDK